ncbi:MAG: hypothetical protein HOO94_01050 [Novosphingobium sp.]|uniref:hypothetical protein n=1 Tax=Novosphingobium sp. TaxID=1874826 RepID=UPI00184399A2|nr:hypothetical protein [Novosphingobium sp.]
MFGPSIFSVFRSRWKALWWAAGILMLAYCAVPSPEDTAQQQQGLSPAEVKALQDAFKDVPADSAE